MDKRKLTPQQMAAKELIKNDLQYLFTVLVNSKHVGMNYYVCMIPYLGLIMDGAEDWAAAMNQVSPGSIVAPMFSAEEQQYYEMMRDGIKLWDKPFDEVYALLEKYYFESDEYFSSLCKPIAKTLRLYDIYGADLIGEHFCGNTILGAVFLPNYHLQSQNYGLRLRKIAEIAGRYITIFNAIEDYQVREDVVLKTRDFGGFVKSPVGNNFSYRFVLFCILCQINFILFAVDGFMVSETPVKLRFAYILYYYLCHMIPQVNTKCGTTFSINQSYYSKDFRNAMAHYKVGVYLKPHEIIPDDPMLGMTQKAFGQSFFYVKNWINDELRLLAKQLELFLEL